MDDGKEIISTVEHLQRSGKDSQCIISVTISPTDVQIEQRNPKVSPITEITSLQCHTILSSYQQRLLYDHQVGDLRSICVMPKKPRIFGYVMQDPVSDEYFCFCLKACKRSGIKVSHSCQQTC